MAKDVIKIVSRALENGFRSRGARVLILAEKSDYKDFIRMIVVSDFFRRKRSKDRLGEIFSMMEENGANDEVTKLSLCVPLTKSEYEKELSRGFLQGPLFGAGRKKNGRALKARPRTQKRAAARASN